MPKLKTHKSSKKRVKVTATGKVLVWPTGARHVMSGKSSKKRRHMRRARPLKNTDRKRVLFGLVRPIRSKPAHAEGESSPKEQ
jgi:large subunit ribosomal protein L35